MASWPLHLNVQMSTQALDAGELDDCTPYRLIGHMLTTAVVVKQTCGRLFAAYKFCFVRMCMRFMGHLARNSPDEAEMGPEDHTSAITSLC